MKPFQFYVLSEDDATNLRQDPVTCVQLLAACKQLAVKLSIVAGIFTPLTEEDEQVLQRFHNVMQAHEGYMYEMILEGLCDCAGLLGNETGLLAGRIEQLFREREPLRYKAEAVSLLHQWLRNRDA